MKNLLIATLLLGSLSAKAMNFQTLVNEITTQAIESSDARGMFDFKVGDTANYSLKMGFIPGTMTMTVTDVQPSEVTLNQTVSLFGQKQECITKMDPNTGENKGTVCNGQQQQAGSPDDIELVEQKEDTVTVPAGTFVCLYIKAKQKSSGDTIEQWINPSEIPVLGMAKSTVPSQFGQTVIELTSFKKM
jgi:hypothetical protein